jgi:hypothetical protein
MQFISNRSDASSRFPDLEINFNAENWGPVSGSRLAAFEHVPYTHFDKKERCYRPADFAQNPQSQRFNVRDSRRKIDDTILNNEFAYKHDTAEDATFQLVDTAKAQSRSKFGGSAYTSLHVFYF